MRTRLTGMMTLLLAQGLLGCGAEQLSEERRQICCLSDRLRSATSEAADDWEEASGLRAELGCGQATAFFGWDDEVRTSSKERRTGGVWEMGFGAQQSDEALLRTVRHAVGHVLADREDHFIGWTGDVMGQAPGDQITDQDLEWLMGAEPPDALQLN